MPGCLSYSYIFVQFVVGTFSVKNLTLSMAAARVTGSIQSRLGKLEMNASLTFSIISLAYGYS